MYGPRSAEPLRVVHVATAYQRHEDDVVTPWLSKLIAAQRDSGLDASVLAPSYKGLASGRVADVPVRRFRYAPRAWETLTHEETVPDRLRGSPAHGALVAPYLAGGLWAALRLGRQRPEVVHVHWPVPHALFGAAARFASEGHTALVCTFYSVEIRWIERRAPWLRPLLAWSVRAPDAVTAISSTTAALVQRIEPREVSVIPFAAALEGADGGGERPAIQDGPLRLLFVGRLVERKGVEHLVRALALVRRSRAAELTIVGDGEWKPVIRQAVEREQLAEHVRFAGYVPERQLRKYYQACDIFVLPAVVDAKGDTEGLGVVLLEALRFERPVIGSNIGGIPDIVRPEETGWLVAPGDAEALAATILEVADDPKRARRVAARGRAYVERRFSLERVTEQLNGVYSAALSKRAAELERRG